MKSITKKGLSAILAIGMITGMQTSVGMAAETPETSYCKVVLDEDFESITEENPSKINFVNAVASHANTFSQVTAETSVYGQGNYNFSFSDTTDSDTFNTAGGKGKNLTYTLLDSGNVSTQAIGYIFSHTVDSDTYGYTAELSFDWNPNDVNASAPESLLYLYANKVQGEYASKPMIGIKYIGGDSSSSGRKLTIFRNSESNILAENIDLTEKIGEEVWDNDHTYRVRFVIKPYTAKTSATTTVNGEENTTDCAGDCTIYMDGVEIGKYPYINNKDRIYLTSLYFSSNKQNACYFDNIKLVEYWDSMTSDTEGAGKYVNDDAILSAIRAAEYKYDKLSASDKTTADAAISSAKAVHTNTESTQEQLDSAAAELKNIMDALKEDEGGNDDEGGEVTPPVSDDYEYIVNNDFEGNETAPFSSGFATVGDSSEIMGSVMKLSGVTGILSDAFDGVNIITDTGAAKRDSVFEFDIKIENYDTNDGLVTLTQWDTRYRESVGQPVSRLSFGSDGITREVGSSTDTEPLKISQADLSDGKWHRIRIVNHSWFAENDQNMYRMSLYVDGECEYPHIRRKSYSQGKVDEFSQFEFAGIPNGAVVHLDNIKVYSTASTSENIPADAGKLMKTVWDIEDFLDNAVVGTEKGTYNIEDINELKNVYDNAVDVVPTLKTQNEVDTKCQELNTALFAIRPIGDDIAVDSLTYSADNLAADGVTEITATASISTTRNAPSENHFTIITALYRNSDSFSGGELVAMASDTTKLGVKQSETLAATIDLSAYTADDRADMYVKTYILTGEERNIIMSTDGSTLGSENNNTAEAEKLYGESAEIFKKLLPGGGLKFSLSIKSDSNDELIVYLSKNGEKLSEITENNISDKLVYFNIVNTSDEGEAVCEFVPDTEGEYIATVYSKAQDKEIYSAKCVYKDNSAVEAALDEISSGKAEVGSHKALLDLDTAKYAAADKSGIDMNELAEYVLDENPNADVYKFKKEYLKNMNLLYSIKTAGNTDEVLAALDTYDAEPSDVTSYELRSIGSNIYKNKSKVTSMEALDELLDYRPAKNNNSGSVGGSSSSGGGSSYGGGGGGGYINTAEEVLSENSKTPYEQSASLFTDLDGFEWAEEEIMFMAGRGVINGKSEGVFAPGDNITREEFAKIVVNMFGIPAGDKSAAFSDVDVDAWYYPYIEAAYSSGIVTGIGDNMFGTGTLISREDACVMLYRAGECINVEYSDKAEFIPFEDECSDYAREAVEALAKSGIVKGTGNNVLQAAKPLTRAEAAKMVCGLYNFAQ